MTLFTLTRRYIAVAIGNSLNVYCRKYALSLFISRIATISVLSDPLSTAKSLFVYSCDGLDIASFEEKRQNAVPQPQGQGQHQNARKQNKGKSGATKDQYGPSQIQHIAYSAKHDCFIVVTEDKRIRILLHGDKLKSASTADAVDEHEHKDDSLNAMGGAAGDGLYRLFGFKNVLKKISSVCLSPIHGDDDEEYFVSADKFGVITVHSLPSLKTKSDGSGHLSIISQIAFDSSGKHLISGDKDFKLRISRFPQLYIIDGLCFGHFEAVTRFVVVDRTDTATANEHDVVEMKDGSTDGVEPQNRAPSTVVVSGSVDGTVRIWSVPFGKELAVFQVEAASLCIDGVGPAVSERVC